MASEKIVTLTKDNFKETVEGGKPVLVDFWASWCGPCQRVAPILEELADEQDAVTIAKLNVDDHQSLAAEFKVQSIPTFILFENGEVKDRIMGAMSKNVFERFLEKHAAAAAS